ncbi:hypothetical protein [Aeromonas rivipollensis]|uniref:hypothetical protein n=1 Tax=Aeromonas rivipollensis TaxID=948519 RepID=UPI003D20BB0F
MEVQNLAGLGISQGRQGTPAKPEFDASNVNDQLGATLNQGGLLMRMAQSKGQGLASSRGLGNSTIGIDAAQRAMVDAALPIAQQNAQQSFASGQSALDRQQQLTMQGNDFANQTNQANLNAKLTQDRDKLLHQQELGTLDKQGQLQLQQIEAELKSQTALNNQQNAFNSAEAAKGRQQQLTMLEKQFGQETATLAQQVAANTHGMYLSAIDTAMGSYNERYAALMADNTMTSDAKRTMLNNMKNELNSTLNMYQKLYSNINTIRPDWTQFPTISLPGVSVA